MAASRRSTRASAVKIVLILHDLQSILWSRRGLSIESLMGVRIGGWPVSAARRLISKSDNILTALIRQRVPLPTELHCSNLARIGGALLEARVIPINGQAQRISSCRQWRPQLRAEE
jgi:hypothetical protein